MFGHIALEDSPPVMCHDEKTVESAEAERRHSEEVRRGDGFSAIVQKSGLPLCRLGIPGSLSLPAQDRALGNIKAGHFQLPVDPWRPPSGFLRDHAEDEFAQLFTNALPASAGSVTRDPGPICLESSSAPAHRGLRLNEDQCALPFRPQPLQASPRTIYPERPSVVEDGDDSKRRFVAEEPDFPRADRLVHGKIRKSDQKSPSKRSMREFSHEDDRRQFARFDGRSVLWRGTAICEAAL